MSILELGSGEAEGVGEGEDEVAEQAQSPFPLRCLPTTEKCFPHAAR